MVISLNVILLYNLLAKVSNSLYAVLSSVGLATIGYCVMVNLL